MASQAMAVVVGHLHTDSIGVRRAASRCMQLQKIERFQAYRAKKRDLLGHQPSRKSKQRPAGSDTQIRRMARADLMRTRKTFKLQPRNPARIAT